MTCPHADSDAAYVLGALDPNEQQDYRAHLVECARCSAAVGELAGMPGFLARLLPDTDSALAAASPPSLVPRLAERVRAQRRIARWRMVWQLAPFWPSQPQQQGSSSGRCRYDGSSDGESPQSMYELCAIDEDGGESLVSSWRQLSDREITIPGSTRFDLSDIDRLEVRTAAGRPVLWAGP